MDAGAATTLADGTDAGPPTALSGDAGPADVAARPSKLLCLIRHGQGVHNPRHNPFALAFLPAMLRKDARLTGKGRRQAAELHAPMEHLPFDLIVVSPLSRTSAPRMASNCRPSLRAPPAAPRGLISETTSASTLPSR